MKLFLNSSSFNNVKESRYLYFFILFCSVVIYVLYLYQALKYSAFILDSTWFVEPAENEHLVYANFLRENNISNISTMTVNGILPIYPDLFHHLANIFDVNVLKSLRMVSNLAFYASMIIIMLWTYEATKSFVLTILLQLLLFGSGLDITYFMMARPDSMYLFFAILSVAILFNFKNTYGVIFAAISVALSVFTKQTAFYFLLFDFLILLYFYFQNEIDIKQMALFIGTFFIVIFYYYLFINNQVFDMYITGLTLYAKSTSLISIKAHIVRLLVAYPLYLVLIFSMLNYLWINKKRGYKEKFWLLAIVLTVIISFKLFGNDAALSNNFILVCFISIVLVIYFHNIISKKIGLNIMLLLLLLASVQNIVTKSNGYVTTAFTKAYNRATSNGNINDSKIFQYFKEHKGNILTDRLDYYIYFSGNKIGYEGSVLSSALIAYKQGIYPKENKLYSPLKELDAKLEKNFNNKAYSAILLGIQDILLTMYPQILKNYKILYTENITNGQFDIKVRILVPKDSDD